MKTILHIDSSVRLTTNTVADYNSISKNIAGTFINDWKENNPQDKIIHRDVGVNPPDFISQEWIAAAFTPAEARTDEQRNVLALSDTLIDELEKSDFIVMSSPMYNYGMPAALKAWFDQINRLGKTFTFDLNRGDYPLEPIMTGKTMVLITSSGEFGFGIGEERERMNHLGPHIQTMSHYLGVNNYYEVKAEYQEFNDDRHKKSVENAHNKAKELATELSKAQVFSK